MRLNGRISVSALRAALRARGEAVEQARQELTAAIRTGEAARRAERAAIAAIGEETEAATSLAQDDFAVEAYAAWLPRGRRTVAEARARRDEAEVAVVLARAALAAARSAEAATEALRDQIAEAARRRAEDTERAAQDDAAGWRAARNDGEDGPAR